MNSSSDQKDLRFHERERGDVNMLYFAVRVFPAFSPSIARATKIYNGEEPVEPAAFL